MYIHICIYIYYILYCSNAEIRKRLDKAGKVYKMAQVLHFLALPVQHYSYKKKSLDKTGKVYKMAGPGTSFPCFTGTKIQIHFLCFTGTKIQVHVPCLLGQIYK